MNVPANDPHAAPNPFDVAAGELEGVDDPSSGSEGEFEDDHHQHIHVAPAPLYPHAAADAAAAVAANAAYAADNAAANAANPNAPDAIAAADNGGLDAFAAVARGVVARVRPLCLALCGGNEDTFEARHGTRAAWCGVFLVSSLS